MSALVCLKLGELVTRAVVIVMVSMHAQLKALHMEIIAMRTHGLDSIWEVAFLAMSLRVHLSLTVSVRVLGYIFGTD